MVSVELISPGVQPGKISYVVIAARYREGWLFVRHRRRGGWEMPAGHPDQDEESVKAAVRELTEETGAIDFVMEPVTYYSVNSGSGKQFGRLFYAEVQKVGDRTDVEEIEAVRVFKRLPQNLSLTVVMSFLYQVARRYADGLKV